MATLILSNEDMNDIMKIVKSLKKTGLLIKSVSETIKNEAKEQKGRFFSMLLGTLGASLLGNLLTCKVKIRAGEGKIRIFHPLANFEIEKYHLNEAKFNVAYSRDNLPKIMNGTCVINLDEFKSIGTHWTALYVNGNNIIYFDSFGVEHIPK